MRGWGKARVEPCGAPATGRSGALRARLIGARAFAAGMGLVATAWTARVAQLERWPAGIDIPVVAGAFAAPLSAYFLTRGFEMRDRRLLWSLGIAALPLYLTALWVVAQTVGDPGGLPRSALRMALLASSLLTGFIWCGLAVGAALLASGGDGSHPPLRLLSIGVTTLPALAAFVWALDRLPGVARLWAPSIAALVAALFVPWVARGLDRSSTARAAAIAVVALGAGAVALALHTNTALAAMPEAALEGFAVDGPALSLRVVVPVAALLPSVGLVALLGVLHGPGPAARTGVQTAIGMAICTLPLLLYALAVSQLHAPLGPDVDPAASPSLAHPRGVS
jgi:hypothetical protein